MITRINEAKTVIKHILCDCKCKFDSANCNSSQTWNNDKCQCECKKYHTCKKDYSYNPSTYICENGKYLKSIPDTSVDLQIVNQQMWQILYQQIWQILYQQIWQILYQQMSQVLCQ